MRRRMFSLALVLVLCLTLCANAVTLYINDFDLQRSLSVSGDIANCYLKVVGEENVQIEATVDLEVKVGNTYTRIDGWSDSATKTLTIDRSYQNFRISSGNCRMHYTFTVDGPDGADTVSRYVYG